MTAPATGPGAPGEPVEVLDPPACWRLLRAAAYGRLAVVDDEGRPDVFCLNHAVDGGTLLLRTAPGAKLAAVRSGRPVAFEVDGVEDRGGAGGGPPAVAWSVVLRGTAEQVRRPAELLATGDVPLEPWQGTPKGVFVRVSGEVSGRRFAVSGTGRWDPPTRAARG